MAVVGNGFRRLNGKALRGAFIALAVDYGLPVFFFQDEEGLAAWLLHLGEREQLLVPRELKKQFAKKTSAPGDAQRLVVESLPLVGPKTALELLKHFRTVRALANAGEKELEEVSGVGGEKAKRIKQVFSAEFEVLGVRIR